MRFVELLGRLELAAVERDRLVQVGRREVRREHVGQAEGGGQIGTEQLGAEDVQRDVGARARVGRDTLDPRLVVVTSRTPYYGEILIAIEKASAMTPGPSPAIRAS